MMCCQGHRQEEVLRLIRGCPGQSQHWPAGREPHICVEREQRKGLHGEIWETSENRALEERVRGVSRDRIVCFAGVRNLSIRFRKRARKEELT